MTPNLTPTATQLTRSVLIDAFLRLIAPVDKSFRNAEATFHLGGEPNPSEMERRKFPDGAVLGAVGLNPTYKNFEIKPGFMVELKIIVSDWIKQLAAGFSALLELSEQDLRTGLYAALHPATSRILGVEATEYGLWEAMQQRGQLYDAAFFPCSIDELPALFARLKGNTPNEADIQSMAKARNDFSREDEEFQKPLADLLAEPDRPELTPDEILGRVDGFSMRVQLSPHLWELNSLLTPLQVFGVTENAALMMNRRPTVDELQSLQLRVTGLMASVDARQEVPARIAEQLRTLAADLTAKANRIQYLGWRAPVPNVQSALSAFVVDELRDCRFHVVSEHYLFDEAQHAMERLKKEQPNVTFQIRTVPLLTSPLAAARYHERCLLLQQHKAVDATEVLPEWLAMERIGMGSLQRFASPFKDAVLYFVSLCPNREAFSVVHRSEVGALLDADALVSDRCSD